MTKFYFFYICLKIKIIKIININSIKIVNKFLIKNDKIFSLLKTVKNEKVFNSYYVNFNSKINTFKHTNILIFNYLKSYQH